MSINFAKLVNSNLINHQHLRSLKDKRIYFFLLGLTISVGDIDIVLLTAIFILTMALSYQINYEKLSTYLQRFIKYLNPEYRQLLSSIIIAGGFSLSSYLLLNIWTELDNKWLALGMIAQIILSGAGLIFLTGIFLKNKHKNSAKNNHNYLEAIVNQLDSPSPLKRLWAINQIILQCSNQRLTMEEYEQIRDYLTIVRALETEPIIIDKIAQCLSLISPILSTPLQMPINSFVAQKKKLKV